jgi:hypothetical protein
MSVICDYIFESFSFLSFIFICDNTIRSISPGVKKPGREADHAPTCSVEFKNGGTMPPLPPYVFMAWSLIN